MCLNCFQQAILFQAPISKPECKIFKLQFCCLNINLVSMKIYTAVMHPIILHLQKSNILKLHRMRKYKIKKAILFFNHNFRRYNFDFRWKYGSFLNPPAEQIMQTVFIAFKSDRIGAVLYFKPSRSYTFPNVPHFYDHILNKRIHVNSLIFVRQ